MLLATISPPVGMQSTQLSHAAVRGDGQWVLLDETDVSALVSAEGWQEWVARRLASAGAHERYDEADLTFLNPLPRPSKIICCGLNYRDHIVETGRDVPEYPTLFAKFADTLTGPESTITVHSSTRVDWEAELAVVVGRRLHRADIDEAYSGILGYTVANDISMRDWQSRTLQWFQGKAFDGTTPLGPVIVTADSLDPIQGLDVSCHVNERLMQSGNTRELVFDAARLLSYVSQFTALSPGDVILSGTPGGVGLGMNPQLFLSDGDVVTTSIEGIGSLRNTIRFDPASMSPSPTFEKGTQK